MRPRACIQIIRWRCLTSGDGSSSPNPQLFRFNLPAGTELLCASVFFASGSTSAVAAVSILELLDAMWKEFNDTHTKICESIKLTDKELAYEYFVRKSFQNLFFTYLGARRKLLHVGEDVLEKYYMKPSK